MTDKMTDTPELKNKKILLVDDEPQLLSMLEQILYSNGFFQIYTAGSCREALNIMEKQQISLCILDVNLPDGDGFFLLREIRKFSQVPVIFLTARGEAEDKIEGLTLGADDYMVKPFLPKRSFCYGLPPCFGAPTAISFRKTVFSCRILTAEKEKSALILLSYCVGKKKYR